MTTWICFECSPSVLDRLNALLEPGGVLTMSERGVIDGTIPTIAPHPNFRYLFLLFVSPSFLPLYQIAGLALKCHKWANLLIFWMLLSLPCSVVTLSSREENCAVVSISKKAQEALLYIPVATELLHRKIHSTMPLPSFCFSSLGLQHFAVFTVMKLRIHLRMVKSWDMLVMKAGIWA